jgi:hypothetical protein
MTKNKAVKPEDILPDGTDHAFRNGEIIRKGTVAAFLANIDILENPHSSAEQIQMALQTMQELAPGVVAVGLHKHVVFKNSQVEKILVNVSSKFLTE